MSTRQAKAELRSAMLAWRGGLSEDERRAASEALLANFRRERPFAAPAIVSAFWPIKDELDIRPLLIELHNEGCELALPVVVGKGQPLAFRAWRPGDALEAGVFGTLQPSAKRDEVEQLLQWSVCGGRLRLIIPIAASKCEEEVEHHPYAGQVFARECATALIGIQDGCGIRQSIAG